MLWLRYDMNIINGHSKYGKVWINVKVFILVII